MTRQYLVRAKLDGDFSEYPKALPVRFGEFLIDRSANSTRAGMLWEYEQFGPDPAGDLPLPKEDHGYPMSLFVVETAVQANTMMDAIALADELMERLEALLRLYQEGNVFVRRHNVWPTTEGGEIQRLAQTTDDLVDDSAPGYQVKPDPVPLYKRPEYNLGDQKLSGFIHFFKQHWPLVSEQAGPLHIAISRFSSSYEKRTLGDRLIELMIAMEALFGSRTEVTYKVALRSSCLIYPTPCEAREKRFKKIKKIYEERSTIVHGNRLDTVLDDGDVDLFEEDVRNAICRLLALRHSGVTLDNEEQLDYFLFFQKAQE